MYRKKKMKALIITKDGIKKVLMVIVVVCFFLLMSLVGFGVAKLPSPSAETVIAILSKGIRDEKINDNDLSRLLGFDLKDAKTILYKYYAQFESVDAAEKTVESSPVLEVKKEDTNIEEYNIESVNIAKGMQISNLSGLDIDAEALSKEALHIKLDNSGPEVLIVHTHTTESFTDAGKIKYSSKENDRSTDNGKNMVAVGEVIKNILEENGIKTIHDTTVHDYPSYSGAYTRSMSTIKSNLEKYPTIKVVLDVHRDGIIKEDGTKVKVLADVSGETAAQCMFVVGSNAQLKHDGWQDNMRLACKLQNYANINYPGLMRPIILRKERFNQQATSGSIIIEVGSNGNTLEEAKTGAKYMAQTLAAVLKEG